MIYMLVIALFTVVVMAVLLKINENENRRLKNDVIKCAHMVNDLREDCSSMSSSMMAYVNSIGEYRRELLVQKETIEDLTFYKDVFDKLFSNDNGYVIMQYKHKENGKINGCRRVTSKDFIN